MTPASTRAAALCCTAALSGTAIAQEMPGMPAATAPSPGVLVPRVQSRAYFFEDDQSLLEQNIRLEYGLVRDLSLSAELPLFQGFLDEPRPGDGEFGTGDADVLVEWRFLRDDLNAVDTIRAAVFAGAELPTATDGFAAGSLDPCVGIVFMSIQDRHGIDLAARYTFVTGAGLDAPLFLTDSGDDFVNLDAGYAYRIHPEAYGEARTAAWYLTAELNGVVTMGGEHELLLSPGLLLEAPTYAIELGCSVPLSADIDRAPDLDFAVLAGLRLLF